MLSLCIAFVEVSRIEFLPFLVILTSSYMADGGGEEEVVHDNPPQTLCMMHSPTTPSTTPITLHTTPTMAAVIGLLSFPEDAMSLSAPSHSK